VRCRNEQRGGYEVVVTNLLLALVRVGRKHVTIGRKRHSQRLSRKGVINNFYGRGGEITHTGGGRPVALR
jgi:hypothetical protein